MKTTFTANSIGKFTVVFVMTLFALSAIAGSGNNGEVVDIDSKTEITIIDDSGVIHDIKNTDTNKTINIGDKVIYVEDKNTEQAGTGKKVKTVIESGHHH